MKRLTVLVGALLAAIILAVGAMPSRQAPPAEARTQGGFAISVPLCTALTLAFFNAIPLPCAGAAPMDSGLVHLSDQAGTDKDGKADIGEFKGLHAFRSVP